MSVVNGQLIALYELVQRERCWDFRPALSYSILIELSVQSVVSVACGVWNVYL